LSCFSRGAESARNDFEGIILLSPYRPAVHRYFADCLQSSYFLDQSLSEYNFSLSLLPDINDPRLNYEHRDYLAFYKSKLKFQQGEVYQAKQNYEQAAVAYQESYNYFPQDLSVLKKSADMYYLNGDLDLTAKILLQILKHSPNDIQVMLNLAKVYNQLDKDDISQIYLQKIIDFEPGQSLPKASELIYN